MKTTLLPVALAALTMYAQPPGGPGGQGDGIWLRNAYFGERDSFDACLGHQPPSGMYHNHVQPPCLRAQLNDNLEVVGTGRTGAAYREKASGWTHSPILGWSFDGYPVYGPYGHADPKDKNSSIKRLKSSFQLRTITARTTLPDWSLAYHNGVPQQLNTNQYGPPINITYPLGRYLEDYDYAAGLGDLDQYNGRFEVTPEYPNGTYAYHVTINDDGSPAFPYVFSAQYYGTVSGGSARTVPSTAQDYFAGGGQSDPLLTSWLTQNSKQNAEVVNGFDPSAGPQTTWPGTTTPVLADVQRIRSDSGAVYVNAFGLASYAIGPWFGPLMPGGVFANWPTQQNYQVQLARSPQAATGTHTATPMGAVGTWVNGVAIFNPLDGGSYSNASAADVGGGLVRTTAFHVSAASFEAGPLAPGSLATAFAEFDAKLATATDQATSSNWPTVLAGATVTVKDSAGVQQQAQISFASPTQVNYRVPPNLASGNATVTISAGGASVTSNINIASAYPGLFKQDATNLAAAQVARLRSGQVVYESVTGAAIALGAASEQDTLVLYGTGIGSAATTATIGGIPAQVLYAGAQGTYPGLDQVNILIPVAVAGKGNVDVIVTSAGKPSNPVNVNF